MKTYRPYLGTLICIGLAVWFFTMGMFGFMLLIFLPLLLITRAVKWWKARRDPQAKRLERFRLALPPLSSATTPSTAAIPKP